MKNARIAELTAPVEGSTNDLLLTVSLSGVLYCLCSFVSLSLLVIFICELIMGGQL